MRNVYSLYFPDGLHQSNRGTPEEVTRLLEARLTAAQKHSLDAYLLACPPFHGFRVPSFGLDTSRRATATKIADLFKLLPVAVLAFTSMSAAFLPALQGRPLVSAYQSATQPTRIECVCCRLSSLHQSHLVMKILLTQMQSMLKHIQV